MIKRTLYPETPRIPEKTDNAIITEKMDGRNSKELSPRSGA